MKIIYTKEDCPACMVLKSKLFSKRIDYKEVMIGKDISREAFMEKFPGVRTVPYVEEVDES